MVNTGNRSAVSQSFNRWVTFVNSRKLPTFAFIARNIFVSAWRNRNIDQPKHHPNGHTKFPTADVAWNAEPGGRVSERHYTVPIRG